MGAGPGLKETINEAKHTRVLLNADIDLGNEALQMCSARWGEELETAEATGMFHCGVLSCRIQARDTQTPSNIQRPF